MVLINTSNPSFFSKLWCTSSGWCGLQAGPDPTPTKPRGVVAANLAQMHEPFKSQNYWSVEVSREELGEISTLKCKTAIRQSQVFSLILSVLDHDVPWASEVVSLCSQSYFRAHFSLFLVGKQSWRDSYLLFSGCPTAVNNCRTKSKTISCSVKFIGLFLPEIQRMFSHLPFAKVLPLCSKAFHIIRLEEDGAEEEEARLQCWVTGAWRKAALFSSVLLYWLYCCCCSFKLMLETKIIIIIIKNNSYRWTLSSVRADLMEAGS